MIRKNKRTAQFWNRTKDADQEHLKRHVHLTNCIHLRHHWHMQKAKMKLDLGGNSSELSLIKELSALKKSRSLRDPSTSPSRKSPSGGSKTEKASAKEKFAHERSAGNNSAYTSIIQESSELNEEEGWVDFGYRLRAAYDLKGEECSTSQADITVIGPSKSLHFMDKHDTHGGHEGRRKGGKKAASPSCQGKEVSSEGDIEGTAFSSEATDKTKPKNRSMKKGKSKKGKRSYKMAPSKLTSTKEDLICTLSTLTPDDRTSWRSSAILDNGGSNASEENNELEISDFPQNACGIPWNWSRLHSTRKNIMDLAAGTSSGGAYSESLARKVAKHWPHGHHSTSGESMPATTSDCSDTTDSESYPLLDAGPLSDSASHSGSRLHEDSGRDQLELSDILAGGVQKKYSQRLDDSHQSLSQKYLPMSFQGIVGQHLVTQALSNALTKGRIASMYIFYGPGGTGKTSCAKVFAQALNCLSSKEPRPCGSCAECLAHRFGKTSVMKEFNAGGNNGKRGIKALMHDIARYSLSQYRVYILDECHHLSNQAWNTFLKVAEDAPRSIVFILSTNSLEQLPHAVVSRCQKFLFTKIKESDIISRLQIISMQEGLEVDAEALKLIASASDGSLRDAEMMLDQLSLLGQKISLPMVQELMGMVPEEDLVELLDFALSADTVNTVRCLKELTVSGVEPLNLMSQLACLITSILAGGYRVPSSIRRRKFFRKKELTKEDMERLRQALKVLSEAEKQLRSSFDRTTWLTAALLQFAPDQSYLLPSSLANTSVTQSPVGPNDTNETPEFSRRDHWHERHNGNPKSRVLASTIEASSGLSYQANVMDSNPPQGSHSNTQERSKSRRERGLKVKHDEGGLLAQSNGKTVTWQTSLTNNALEEVWQRVLDAVHSNSLRKFLQTQAKLLSLSLCKGFAVALIEFCQAEHALRAERSKTSISHAFQVTVGYPVDIKVHLAAKEAEHVRVLADHPSTSNSLWQPPWMPQTSAHLDRQVAMSSNVEHREEDMKSNSGPLEVHRTHPTKSFNRQGSTRRKSFEIVALEPTQSGRLPMTMKGNPSDDNKLENAWLHRSLKEGGNHHCLMEGSSSRKEKRHDNAVDFRSNSRSRNGVSLGFVIQQAEGSVEGYSQDLQFDNMNEVSNRNMLRHRGGDLGFTSGQEEHPGFAAELEEENLRLESRSGGLLCWNSTQRGHEKAKEGQQSSRRQGVLMSLCPCAKSNKS